MLWGPGIARAPSATNYVDTNVVTGTACERAIFKDTATYGYFAEGYILTGILAPATEQRGKVVLLVDNTLVSSTATSTPAGFFQFTDSNM